jgi:hypothetical protein
MPEYEIEESDSDLQLLCPWTLTRDGVEIAHFMGEVQALEYRDYLIDQAKEDV